MEITLRLQEHEDVVQLILKLATNNKPELGPSTKCCTHASHFGGYRFKSQPGDWLCRSVLQFSSIPSGKCWLSTSN